MTPVPHLWVQSRLHIAINPWDGAWMGTCMWKRKKRSRVLQLSRDRLYLPIGSQRHGSHVSTRNSSAPLRAMPLVTTATTTANIIIVTP